MSQFEFGNAANDEASQRKALSWLFAQVSAGKATTGVLSGLQVAQTTTASSSVTIAAGAGVVQAATLDGVSLLANDAQLTLDVLGPDPMGGLPRNDIIVFDLATLTTVAGGAAGGLKYIKGTPNASPTDPTVPTSAIPLARLAHLASATTVPAARITDLRAFTALSTTGEWVTLALAGGVTGTLKMRNRGSTIDVAGDLTGTFTAGFTQVSGTGAIPAAARPTITPPRGVAYTGSGTALGSVEILTTGTINVQVETSRTVAKFNFSYPAG